MRSLPFLTTNYKYTLCAFGKGDEKKGIWNKSKSLLTFIIIDGDQSHADKLLWQIVRVSRVRIAQQLYQEKQRIQLTFDQQNGKGNKQVYFLKISNFLLHLKTRAAL